MIDINYSPAAYNKLILAQFGKVNKLNLLQSWYYYVIDSQYRTKRRLDKFIKKQLINPDERLVKLANELCDKNHDFDNTIINILSWVIKNIKYKYDSLNFGKSEYWASAIETIEKGEDDCDGMNALVYILARLAGVPDYILYNHIGDVKQGGHYWLTYYSPRYAKMVAIDATYYKTKRIVKLRPHFVYSKEFYVKSWYIFNDKIIFKVR